MLELGAAVIADGLLDFTKRLLIRRVCHHARGNVILVRYADDIVAGFERQTDAERFQAELRDRLARFALTLHPDKTRLIQFGRREERERVDLRGSCAAPPLPAPLRSSVDLRARRPRAQRGR